MPNIRFCRHHAFLPLLSFTAYNTRPRRVRVPPPPPLHLNREVHLGYCGVSAGVSRGIWWVKEATQTTIPRMPWGPIKVSDYSPFGGGGEKEGLQLLLVVVTAGGLLPQDLKEKKLVEEKENGKDAATNGKVGAPPSASTPHAPPPLTHALPGERRERRPGS